MVSFACGVKLLTWKLSKSYSLTSCSKISSNLSRTFIHSARSVRVHTHESIVDSNAASSSVGVASIRDESSVRSGCYVQCQSQAVRRKIRGRHVQEEDPSSSCIGRLSSSQSRKRRPEVVRGLLTSFRLARGDGCRRADAVKGYP